ncbi:hypothetical protein J1F62_06385 [Klebsiella michiganensis]|uniref:hypothetical protein n=1 Tax=Klebsiella TaxID=570 RepID=UPI001A911CBA|nr:hypothetical protein [Klebsiella michiganensis]QSW15739.1 hypothetical protein J1F62_06385 [Klebsiella michiganensis]
MKLNFSISDKISELNAAYDIYDELSDLDFNKTISEEVNKLDEDLLQITFINGNTLDIGWYPAFEEEGEFIIQIISNENWEEPIFKSSAHWNINELNEKFEEALNICLATVN